MEMKTQEMLKAQQRHAWSTIQAPGVLRQVEIPLTPFCLLIIMHAYAGGPLTLLHRNP
jgi:hypothetical protein